MISRVWTARAAAADMPAYRAHLERTVFPVLRDIAGYEGAQLMTRADAGEIEVLVVTWWTSLDAIRAFAGRDVERAVVDEAVRPLLSTWDDRVRHYEVALTDDPD